MAMNTIMLNTYRHGENSKNPQEFAAASA